MTMRMTMKIGHVQMTVSAHVTERQFEVLQSLRGSPDLWLRPMDVGGTDGSHHSKTLAQLAGKGLAERILRGGHTRAAWAYRATALGMRARLVVL